MTKFARVCMRKCNEITTRLEVTLGPGTGGLRMRFGLHSGPGMPTSNCQRHFAKLAITHKLINFLPLRFQ
jgi:hypothetical protein